MRTIARDWLGVALFVTACGAILLDAYRSDGSSRLLPLGTLLLLISAAVEGVRRTRAMARVDPAMLPLSWRQRMLVGGTAQASIIYGVALVTAIGVPIARALR